MARALVVAARTVAVAARMLANRAPPNPAARRDPGILIALGPVEAHLGRAKEERTQFQLSQRAVHDVVVSIARLAKKGERHSADEDRMLLTVGPQVVDTLTQGISVAESGRSGQVLTAMVRKSPAATLAASASVMDDPSRATVAAWAPARKEMMKVLIFIVEKNAAGS
ncbi:unnamed protein product [Parascedosporium putredinis]|uniref:Uncharacterized protein n=1 Tax=Parascedosporium putredinis TaxID=1442378 RepID=A0A9P1H4X5_9PEZI|nr:unnamed protein product [Parascedosporium putredinis]CAI7997036.1 unnamed protein product [Parascedosporium putredinis]